MIHRPGSALLALALLAAACTGGNDDDAVDTPAAGASTLDPLAADEAIPTVDAPEPDPTPLPVDPDVRIGRLDNGLTYYLRSNDAPGGSLALRLVVDAGSIHQSDPGDGSAHFLEHMLFNGTEQFPGNELDRSLQRLGIQFGPDVNAATSHDDTVYFLAASATDPAAVEIAFDVLAEWAAAATIDPAQVVDEIGVVREESRFRRESSAGILISAFDDIYTAGSAYESADPIGTEAGIETTSSERLRTYYDRWYRPDNMAVVVVGDLPLDDMEDAVNGRFADLARRVTESLTTIERARPLVSTPSAHVVTHPDQVVANLSVDIPLTIWDERTLGGERLVVVESLLATLIRNRLDDAVQRGRLGIVSETTFEAFHHTRGLRYYGTNLQAPDLAVALDELMAELLAAARTGFTDDEIDAAVAQFGASLDSELAGLRTRQDGRWADDYTFHFLGGAGIDSIPSTVTRQRAILDSIGNPDLTHHWRWILQTGGPIVAAVGADPAQLPTVDDLLIVLDNATAATTTASESPIDALMTAPDPIDPVRSDGPRDTPLEPITWEFANGATVIHVPSAISEGTVDLLATGNGGWSTLAPGAGSIAGIVTTAVGESGRGDIDAVQLDRFLAPATVTLQPFIDETQEGFTGFAATSDAELLFQLVHLGVTAPRADATAVQIALNAGRNSTALVDTDPEIRALAELVDARTGGDPSYGLAPAPELFDALDAEEILRLYHDRLGGVDDLVVAVVGDIATDDVEDLARRYIGTLPARDTDTWSDHLPPMPDGVIRREVVLDDDITATGIDLWYSSDIGLTPETEIAARVLETILSSRLFDTVREELGASYGGTASIVPTRRPRESIDVFIDVDGDPSRLDTILATIDAQISALVDRGPTDEEFDRAVAVLDNEFDFLRNGLFLDAALDGAHFPDADVLQPGDRDRVLAGIGVDDVRKLAFSLFPPDQRIEVVRTTP